MPINDYKEITIPEGSVKKIEDSNGNIIWGSQSAFPYRRLEYLHFNGTDNFIWSQFNTKAGYHRNMTISLDRTDVRQITLGCYDGQATSTARNFFVFDFNPTNGARCSIGNTWSGSTSMSNIPINTQISVWSTCTYTNNANHLYAGVDNVETGTAIISQQTVNGSSSTLTSLQPYIMANRNRASDGTFTNQYFTQGKLYKYQERSGNASGTIIHESYPVQRKSDGAFGVYDVITDSFWTLQGSTDNNTAGPIADEYWDLTAPE